MATKTKKAAKAASGAAPASSAPMNAAEVLTDLARQFARFGFRLDYYIETETYRLFLGNVQTCTFDTMRSCAAYLVGWTTIHGGRCRWQETWLRD